MAARDITPATATYGAGWAAQFSAAPFSLWDKYFDAAKTNVDNSGNALFESGNTIDLIVLPVGAYVLSAGVEIVTAETTTTTATLSLGRVGAATEFVNAQASNATAGTIAVPALSTAVAINTAVNLRLTINTAALTNLKFRVFCITAQLGRRYELV